jgi:hypothetical protein
VKIASAVEVERCLDGTSVMDVTFEFPVTKELIDAMRNIGSVQYYGDFPRPFYTLEVPAAFSLRGVEGSPSVRMITSGSEKQALARLTSFLAGIEEG